MWTIIKNEWLLFLRNKSLKRISLCFALLIVVSAVLSHLSVENLDHAHAEAKDHVRKQWESIESMNPHSAAHYGTYVFKKPHALNSIDQGVTSVTGNVLRVEGHVQNEITHSESSQMQAVSKFGKLNGALLLQYIIPLLLIFLSFHLVSSEQKSGRLKLLTLQGGKVSNFVWAKCVSVWLYGLLFLLLVLASYFLLNLQEITGDTLLRTTLFFVVYALYYFIICAITIFISARWQNATAALTTMLGVWILWTIFIPNIFISSIEKMHELPSRNQFQREMKEDRAKGIDGHNPKDKRGEQLKKDVLAKYNVDSLSQLPINFDGIRMQADEEYGNIVWDKHFGNVENILAKQRQTYSMAGFVNPFIALRNASMGLAASDNFHHTNFLRQVEMFRRTFIKTLNDKQTYGGSKTGDWSWKEGNDFYKSVEDFDFQPVSIASVRTTYMLDFIVLILWSLAALLLVSLGVKKVKIQ